MEAFFSSTQIEFYRGPILVSVCYVILYYLFISNILFTKNRLKKEYKAKKLKFDRYFGQDREMLAADRIQLNMLEHMPPFLILLWLCAFVVSPLEATIYGGIYTASRAFYPFIVGKSMGMLIPMSILFVTGIGYLMLFLIALRIIQHL